MANDGAALSDSVAARFVTGATGERMSEQQQEQEQESSGRARPYWIFTSIVGGITALAAATAFIVLPMLNREAVPAPAAEASASQVPGVPASAEPSASAKASPSASAAVHEIGSTCAQLASGIGTLTTDAGVGLTATNTGSDDRESTGIANVRFNENALRDSARLSCTWTTGGGQATINVSVYRAADLDLSLFSACPAQSSLNSSTECHVKQTTYATDGASKFLVVTAWSGEATAVPNAVASNIAAELVRTNA